MFTVLQRTGDRPRSGSVGCVDRRSSSPTTAMPIEREDGGIGHVGHPQDAAIPNEGEDNALIEEYHYIVVGMLGK